MLDSLASQDLGPYKAEIIFVMNNCTDDSEGVIRRSGLDCTIIYCLTQGCGPARNAALNIAKGKYLWFMDGDDWLLSDTAVKDVLDKAMPEDLDIVRIPFYSTHYVWQYFSMVWQYLLKRSFVSEFRFPDYQPAEDDAYMDRVLNKAGYNRATYLGLPHIHQQVYFYNYMREGSNMFRHMRGEKI
jgi:glycosyltransferase involved in cell wall biosynthesis